MDYEELKSKYLAELDRKPELRFIRGRNPLELSQTDAARLNALSPGGVIDIDMRDRQGNEVTKAILARRNESGTTPPCGKCVLSVKPTRAEGICPYFRTCFGNMRPDKTSVYFEGYTLANKFR